VNAEIQRLQHDPSKAQLPSIPGVNTLAGRVVLTLLKQNIQRYAKTSMDRLIQANENTRQKIRTGAEETV
jgi:hypothetical protein